MISIMYITVYKSAIYENDDKGTLGASLCLAD